MKRKIVLGITAAMALGAAQPAYAYGRHHRGNRYRYMDLGLTADQQKQISDLRTALELKMTPLRNEMATQSSELRRLWAAPTPDRKAIQDKQGQMDQTHKQMRDVRMDYRLAVLKVLTPAQREKLQTAGEPGFGLGGGYGRWGHRRW
jgi:Spy/CpxP family protein refolding chaperone